MTTIDHIFLITYVDFKTFVTINILRIISSYLFVKTCSGYLVKRIAFVVNFNDIAHVKCSVASEALKRCENYIQA